FSIHSTSLRDSVTTSRGSILAETEFKVCCSRAPPCSLPSAVELAAVSRSRAAVRFICGARRCRLGIVVSEPGCDFGPELFLRAAADYGADIARRGIQSSGDIRAAAGYQLHAQMTNQAGQVT